MATNIEYVKDFELDSYQNFSDINREYYNSKKDAEVEVLDGLSATERTKLEQLGLNGEEIENVENLEDGHFVYANGVVIYKQDGDLKYFDAKDCFYYEGNGKYFAVTGTNSNGEVVGMLQMDPNTGEIKDVAKNMQWVSEGDYNAYLMTGNGDVIYNVDGKLRYAEADQVKRNTDGTTIIYDKINGKNLVFDDNSGHIIAQSTLIDNPYDDSNSINNSEIDVVPSSPSSSTTSESSSVAPSDSGGRHIPPPSPNGQTTYAAGDVVGSGVVSESDSQVS